MSRPDRNRSKVRIVESEVQLGLARRIVLHWVAFMAVGCSVAAALQIMADPLRSRSEHIQALTFTLGPFVVAMLAMLPVFVTDTIKFSLRFAGPIFRMRKMMHELAQGKVVQPLKTRKSDFWKTTIDEFNTLVARLNEQHEEPSRGA